MAKNVVLKDRDGNELNVGKLYKHTLNIDNYSFNDGEISLYIIFYNNSNIPIDVENGPISLFNYLLDKDFVNVITIYSDSNVITGFKAEVRDGVNTFVLTDGKEEFNTNINQWMFDQYTPIEM